MPHELHDENYVSQAINQSVVLRRQFYDNVIAPHTAYPIQQGKKIHDLQWIYGLYGALDGLSSSFSMLKYFFDVYYANSSLSTADVADEVHDWMMTPVGMLLVGLETTVLVSVSIIANQFSGMKRLNREELLIADHWPRIKQRIVEDWPYLRDSMKAMKNGYKGVRNVFVFANLLGMGRDLRYMIMPIGLVLGALSAYNRPWLRKMRFERDRREKENRDLCKRLLKSMTTQNNRMLEASPHEELATWRLFQEDTSQEIVLVHDTFERQSQSNSFSFCASLGQMTGLFGDQPTYQSFWFYAYLSAAFNGLLDAPYLILGVVSLTAVAPSLWIFSAAAFLSIICVVTRLYEEHNLQREFLVTQLAVQSALCIRQFTGMFAELKIISAALFSQDITSQERGLLIAAKAEILVALARQMEDSQRCRDELKRQSVLSFGSLVLCGLKNGVEAFGVIASLMFAVASIYAMTMTAYPPFLLSFFIASGMACLILYVADALLSHVEHWNEMMAADEQMPRGSMVEHVQTLTSKIGETNVRLDQADVEEQINTTSETILAQMRVIPSRQYFYQYWFEVPRLLCSGVGKGIRIVDSILVSWQALGDDGHYHDTDNMTFIAKVSAVIVSIVFALRGFANASDKNMKQNARDDRGCRGENIARSDSDPQSPSGRPPRTPSPSSLPGAWLPFFQQNTPTMPPAMRSVHTLTNLTSLT